MPGVSNQTKTILSIIKVFIQIFWNILLYTLVIIAVFRLSHAVYDFSYQIFGTVTAEEAPGTDMPMEIKKGEGTMELAQKLENLGIIKDKYTFYVRAKLSTGSKKPILPGNYKLNTSMTYKQIISVITNESATEVK